MSSSTGRFFILLFFCALIALPLRSQEIPPVKPFAPKKANGGEKKSLPASDSKKTNEQRKMDLSSLPADVVIFICEHANEALDLVPKAVVLRPDRYQALLDQIAKLKKEIDKPRSEKITPPTRCFLRGKVESGAVHIEAEFAGTAEHADTLVALGCNQAGASAAETDGRMAQIRRAETGSFLVRIEKPGEYHIKLDLLLPLASREGTRRGFELTLPHAVITKLELDLPAECTDVRVGGQLVKELQQTGLELKNNHLSGNPGLGPVDKLDLSWNLARQGAEDSVRTAEGRILARLDAAGLTTEADLLLKTEGAPAKTWSLLIPKNAEIKVLPSEKEDRVEHRIETAEQPFASLRTIHLKEARTEPLRVQVKVPLLPLHGSDSIIPVGPFFVLNTARQTGTVRVRNQVRNLHLDYRGHGDMQLRRLDTEESKGESPATVATLVYSNIPMEENPDGVSGPKSRSWLDLEAVLVPVQARMRVSHTLTLRSSGPNSGKDTGVRQWEVLTAISPATKWSEAEQLEILVPADWSLIDENVRVVAKHVSGVNDGESKQPLTTPDLSARWLTIPTFLLRAPTQSQRLEGRYQAKYKAGEHAVLKLPRPQGTIESCEIKIEAPVDAEVFLNNADQVNLELTRQPRPNEQTWRCRSVPADGLGIEVSWRPYRPELRAFSVVDLTLRGNRGEVRQELRLQMPPSPPSFVNLRVPAAIGNSFQIKDDQGRDVQTLQTEVRNSASKVPSSNSDSRLRIPTPSKAGEWKLVLNYRFSDAVFGVPDAVGRGSQERQPIVESRQAVPFVVPLVTAEQATGGELKVRIWSEPGFVPRAASPHWEERNVEEVKDRDLPILVLHANRLDAPLRLLVGEEATGLAVLVERAQMRVQLLESGAQNWRASFRLRQLSWRNLEVLLPAPAATLTARFLLNGIKITPDIVNEKGEHTFGGDIARLHLSPDLVRQTASLEVLFQSPPGRNGASPLRSLLQPPRILRAMAMPAYWEVSIPANRVLLAPESGAGVERIWTRRGFLWAAGFSPTVPSSPSPQPGIEISWAMGEPIALVCWQDQTMPIVLTHVPHLGWLLVCSLGLLVVGLGLSWSARPQANGGGRIAPWFWMLLAFLILAIAVAALFWPTMLCAIAYGCEPGALVIVAILSLQWLMHRRYRRQIVFLPSFSRSRGGSSLIRKTPSNRPQSGEPSTVDAPPPSVG
ncbi:MAG TPA: hypothetical protein VE999_11880 [Gemmataceae bacterium]|nr:hypothetical protein [Gemmataceae bacterium]